MHLPCAYRGGGEGAEHSHPIRSAQQQATTTTRLARLTHITRYAGVCARKYLPEKQGQLGLRAGAAAEAAAARPHPARTHTNMAATPPAASAATADAHATLRRFLAQFQKELDDEERLESEFDDAFVWETSSSNYSCATAQDAQNVQLNRYANVLPYDHALVPVAPPNSSREYINASWLTSTRDDAAAWRYICTQGPLPHTSGTFWRMVYAQRPVAIAMLTGFVEKRIQKCHEYFPATLEDELYTDDDGHLAKLRIACERVETLVPGLEERNIVVESLDPGGETIRVSHFHYTEWPDHGTPGSTHVLRLLIHRMRKLQELRAADVAGSAAATTTTSPAGAGAGHDSQSASAGSEAPLVVHCSAGVGRTGVFCACDVLIRRIDAILKHPHKFDGNAFAAKFLNIPSLIKFFRTQRVGMVQTREQYVFCFRLLAEELQLRVEMSKGSD